MIVVNILQTVAEPLENEKPRHSTGFFYDRSWPKADVKLVLILKGR